MNLCLHTNTWSSGPFFLGFLIPMFTDVNTQNPQGEDEFFGHWCQQPRDWAGHRRGHAIPGAPRLLTADGLVKHHVVVNWKWLFWPNDFQVWRLVAAKLHGIGRALAAKTRFYIKTLAWTAMGDGQMMINDKWSYSKWYIIIIYLHFTISRRIVGLNHSLLNCGRKRRKTCGFRGVDPHSTRSWTSSTSHWKSWCFHTIYSNHLVGQRFCQDTI